MRADIRANEVDIKKIKSQYSFYRQFVITAFLLLLNELDIKLILRVENVRIE